MRLSSGPILKSLKITILAQVEEYKPNESLNANSVLPVELLLGL